MKQNDIKINVGCGPSGQIRGFDNIDNSPNITISKIPFLKKILYRFGLIAKHQYASDWSDVIKCDASRKLPYKNHSVSKIYTSHFLEHIPSDRGLEFLKECYRVLKKGGTMRLVVPDLFLFAEQYVESTKILLSSSSLSDDRSYHDKFLETIYGAYIKKKRYGRKHCYMYDLPTLVSLLKNIGFQDIKSFGYQEGDDDELSSYDSRPDDSLHLEAFKKIRN
jgi:ubiquinone/menaquinone biosynthesis C-methylase UbiE